MRFSHWEKKTDKKRAIMIECQFHHAESNVRYISKFNLASLVCRFSLLCVNIKLLLTFFFARWFVMSCLFFFFFLDAWPRIQHFLKAEILDNVHLWSKDSTLRVKGENGMFFFQDS